MSHLYRHHSLSLSFALKVAFTLSILALLIACDPRGASGLNDGPVSAEPTVEGPIGIANIEELEHTLSFEREVRAEDAHDVVSFALYYVRRPNQHAPRTVELMVDFPASMSFMGATPLSAVTLASKELIVQQPSPGVLRVVILAAGNLNYLETGPLARFSFKGEHNGGALSVRERVPYFAPLNANEGVTLAPPTSMASDADDSRE